jgi:hypothetical protein
MKFPRKPVEIIRDRVLHVSVPFTWQLPAVRRRLVQRGFEWDTAIVGGPAVYLMPEIFDGLDHVSIGQDFPGILQIINPMATKTTTGCVRRCPFCMAWRFEGELVEFADWPDRPILIDNNLLAASSAHFDRVIDRLVKWGWADFNQGLDVRLLDGYHARRLAEIKRPIIRLAMDNVVYANDWLAAVDRLRAAGIRKHDIRSLALIGFDSDPAEAWARCELIEDQGIKASPLWFHRLDALKHNEITDRQRELGWTDYERRRIMQWFYQHKRAAVR